MVWNWEFLVGWFWYWGIWGSIRIHGSALTSTKKAQVSSIIGSSKTSSSLSSKGDGIAALLSSGRDGSSSVTALFESGKTFTILDTSSVV